MKQPGKVLSEIYRPDVEGNVRPYDISRGVCQRNTPKGSTTKVTLEYMPLIDISFHRVAVDFIGPIQPATNCDNCYILTLEDFLLGI